MPLLDKTAWEVLNATADDCENLEQIYRQLCFDPLPDAKDGEAGCYRTAKGAPLLSEIADRIRQLMEDGLLVAEMDANGHPMQQLDDLSYVWRAWFRMTPAGKSAWESSDFANLVEQD